MRWEGYVVRIGKMRIIYKALVGKLKGRENSEDLSVDGSIILKQMLGK
jgi:hypothetical protein